LLDEDNDKRYLQHVLHVFSLPYDDVFVKSLYQLVSTKRFKNIADTLSSSHKQSDRDFVIDIYKSFDKIKISKPYVDAFFGSS
jgi:hypothetical protein